MNNKHVAIVRRGKDAIQQWRSRYPDSRLDLREADLSGTNLSGAHLSGACLVEANFSSANLSGASVEKADFREATLNGADLTGCWLFDADLNGACLESANLSMARLDRTDCSNANFNGANLRRADFTDAKLHATKFTGANLAGAAFTSARLERAILDGANLTKASFLFANLNLASLNKADMTNAELSDASFILASLSETQLGLANFSRTNISHVDLSNAVGLDNVHHDGPSFIGVDTLSASKGKIPKKFLLGCGVPEWLISARRLFDPELTPNECSDILSTEVFMKRVAKVVFFGGAFISYSHVDRQFVDQLHGRLLNEGLPAWLDIHDAVAGPLGKQVTETIRSRDVVILILSQHSLQSDWVWHEIRTARAKEKKESRYILCPITLDDAWSKPDTYGPQVQKAVEDHQVEIGYLKDNNILPFHDPHPFDTQFSKLIRGIVRYYGRPADGTK